MSEWPADSVGLVQPQQRHFDTPLMLACGIELPSYELVYECYGALNAERSNAILICHALSSDHHVAGYYEGESKPGWWEVYVGPGKAFDTNRFYIICANNIGGCSGSTGPTSQKPDGSEPYGPDFPPVRVRDWVHCQQQLMDVLGIEQWAAVVGSSLGGMQVLRWALEYPEAMRHGIVLASAMKLTAQNIAFNEIARRAITADPDFTNGRYLERGTMPNKGLAIARMIGHLTYMSDDLMALKFGRDLYEGSFERGQATDVRFQVESYLRHQGDKFADSFDANSYLLLTRALDYFDLAREYNDDPMQAFKRAQAEFLVVSFSSDWRFAPARSREMVRAMLGAGRRVSYAEINAPQGHDAFLLPVPRFDAVLRGYLQRVAAGARA